MIINNYEKLSTLLDFPSEDIFYHLQILQRKKDHPELLKDTHVIKVYYIKSLNDLSDHWDEIKNLCRMFRARAMLNINARSFRKCTLESLKILADYISNVDFKKSARVFDHACGVTTAGLDHRWVIDIDYPLIRPVVDIKDFIYKCRPEGDKIITEIPTAIGMHLITRPFDRKQFGDEFKNLYNIHTNNPTLLYFERD
ncbi:MAG: hypothetical protein M0R17_01980 [Candidatus Omnitrophica bacterium]|jgi:hypothetical protein|nr:hypothetical protein [Candidatus Omnitrophota bacterium]